jgi:hypothetical protein
MLTVVRFKTIDVTRGFVTEIRRVVFWSIHELKESQQRLSSSVSSNSIAIIQLVSIVLIPHSLKYIHCRIREHTL